MLQRIIAKIAVYALRSKRLSGEQKVKVTSALLDNLSYFPIQDVITIDAVGNVQVRGRSLDAEQKINLHSSASTLKTSFARRLINEQLTFKAINVGVHKAQNIETILFSQAVLWVIQEENALINQFTGEDDTD